MFFSPASAEFLDRILGVKKPPVLVHSIDLNIHVGDNDRRGTKLTSLPYQYTSELNRNVALEVLRDLGADTYKVVAEHALGHGNGVGVSYSFTPVTTEVKWDEAYGELRN